MARIAGVNIPTNKHVGIALTHIFGIGRNRALTVCKAAGVDSTPAALQTLSARFRPMPKMCVSAIPTCLLVGILTPAIRAIVLTSSPAAACAAGLRKSRAPHRGGARSCTSYKSCELTF